MTTTKRRTKICHGCGAVMRENLDIDFDAWQDASRAWTNQPQDVRDVSKYPRSREFSTPNGHFGYGNNDHFCTMRCGFRFALRVIQ